MTPSIDYGITNALGISLSLPYVWHSGTHRVSSTVYENEREKGVSDLIASLRYSWRWRFLNRNLAVSTSAGVTIPVTEKKLAILTDAIDFTTGTVDPVIGITGSLGLNNKTVLRVTAFTRQVWGMAEDEQQVGSYYAYTLELRRLINKASHSVYGRLFSEIREQYQVSGRGYRNSGGEWLFGVLGGSYTLIAGDKAGLRLTGEIEFPLTINVNGTQPVQGTNLRVNLTSGISL